MMVLSSRSSAATSSSVRSRVILAGLIVSLRECFNQRQSSDRTTEQGRHDPVISDADFSRRILDLVSRDETGPIFKLITSLVDDPLLAGAAAEALITSTSI